jgi:hypothetical protein
VREVVIDQQQHLAVHPGVDRVERAHQRADLLAAQRGEVGPPEGPGAQHRLTREHLPAPVPTDEDQREPGVRMIVEVAQELDAFTGQPLRLVDHDRARPTRAGPPRHVWRGWPFSTIAAWARRLSCAHAVVIAGGILTYVVADDLLGLDDTRVAAVAGCFVAAGLMFGMLFEDWLSGRLSTYAERAALLVLTLALAALLAVVLGVTADALPLAQVSPDEWVEHAALNALSISIILHVAIGRRWPFQRPPQRSRASTDTSGQAMRSPKGEPFRRDRTPPGGRSALSRRSPPQAR